MPGGSGLAYRVYLVNGLRADGLSAGEGIRAGRQEGREASFANPSITGRLEWARPGVKIGGSFWYGGTADTNSAVGTGTFGAPVALVSADARYDSGPFAMRAVGVTYKPAWNTAFKWDYRLLRNAAGAGESEVLSLGVGYQFYVTFALAVLLLTVQTPAAPPAKLAASIARVFGPATRVDTLLADTVRVLRVSRADSL